MIKKRINKLRSKFINYGIDGYVVPKNDKFFSEYTNKDRLKFISNFTGSAGYAVILKNRNYLFVDGRYTIQSRIESGKNFKILDYFKIINTKVFRNLIYGKEDFHPYLEESLAVFGWSFKAVKHENLSPFSFKAFNVAIVTRFLSDFTDIPILLFDPENV